MSIVSASGNPTLTLTQSLVTSLSGIIISKIQRAMRMDSNEMGVSVHLVAGVWGLLAPGFLAAQPAYEDSFAGES